VLVRTNATGCLPGCSDLRGINRSSLKKIDWIREKAPNADRVSFWLRTEASGTEGALWFLLDVIFTPVGNKFRG